MATIASVGGEPQPLQIATNGTGHTRQKDVVDGDAQRLAHLANLGERERFAGEPPAARQPALKRARRCGAVERGRDAPVAVFGELPFDAHPITNGPHGRRDLAEPGGQVPQGPTEALPGGRQRRRLPRGRNHGGLVRRVVVERGEHVQHADAVGVGVVQQRDQGDAAAVEALDHPGLPQRAVAIQRVGVDLLDERAEFRHPARGGTDDPAHVRVEVEFGILDPDRVMQAQRCGQVPQPEDRKQVGALLEHLPRLRPRPAVRVGRRVEHADLEGVVVGAAAVEIQHQRVNAVEPAHHRPLWIRGWWKLVSARSRPECSCRPADPGSPGSPVRGCRWWSRVRPASAGRRRRGAAAARCRIADCRNRTASP